MEFGHGSGLKAEGAAMASAQKTTGSQSVIPELDVTGGSLSAPRTDVTLEPISVAGPITDINLDIPPVAATDSNADRVRDSSFCRRALVTGCL